MLKEIWKGKHNQTKSVLQTAAVVWLLSFTGAYKVYCSWCKVLCM